MLTVIVLLLITRTAIYHVIQALQVLKLGKHLLTFCKDWGVIFHQKIKKQKLLEMIIRLKYDLAQRF